MVLMVFVLQGQAEFRISLSDNSEVCDPDAAFGARSYLVTWTTYYQSRSYIRARIVTDQGGSGDELRVDSSTVGIDIQIKSAVAWDGEKWFVVWSVNNLVVRGRFVDTNGTISPDLIVLPCRSRYVYPDPAVVFNGTNYLVVWVDDIYGTVAPDIYGARVTPEGVVLDPQGLRISQSFEEDRAPAIASGGDYYFVCWEEAEFETGWQNSSIIACAVGANGTVYEPFAVAMPPSVTPSVAYDGSEYLVTWVSPTGLAPGIWGIKCTYKDTVGDQFTVHGGSGLWNPDVAHENIYGNYFTAWVDSQPGQDGDIKGQRTKTSGQNVGPLDTVCGNDEANQRTPAVAFGNHRYLAVWADDRPGGGFSDIYGQFVTPWQEHFYSQTELATAYNQGRNLALDPVTGWLHAVYWNNAEGPADEDIVYYTYSTDQGEHWAPYEVVATDAAFPCVVVENPEFNPIWVCYKKTQVHDIAVSAKQINSGIWEEYFLFDGSAGAEPGPPSMSMRYDILGLPHFPSVYVAFAVDYGTSSAIEFRTVELGIGITYPRTIVTENFPNSVSTPTVATTPGDIVHLAWKKNRIDPGPPRELAEYCLWWYGGEWSEPTDMSNWNLSLNCEPAFNPCIDAYGDSLVGVWDAPWDQEHLHHEVWRRAKFVLNPQFDPTGPPAPRSISLQSPSVYPQNSTNRVIAWQEEFAPEAIYGYIEGMPQPFPIFQDGCRSLYPDIVAEPPDPTGPDLPIINTLWTHARDIVPGYEVKFLRYQWTLDAKASHPYYDCVVGDSVQSYFCLARDGWAKWREFKVDYGREHLRYRLPFLNPNCIYLLRAVLYHTARDTWTQTFSFEGRTAARFSYRGLVPETVWITIPGELYRSDCEVTLGITRDAGKFASLAGLTLYQLYPYRQGKKGGIQASVMPTVFSNSASINSVRPSPFRGRTQVNYSLMREQHVSIRLYDIQGRLVRELVSSPHRPGNYTIQWDGKDNEGSRLPAGTYFCRLEPAEGASSLGVVLLR